MSRPNPFQTSAQQRVVRVFVSSTFRDMHAEREELVKRFFPLLRDLCESRGVAFTEIDLRWGVTDEQKAEGEVLPICLNEINNCRPFFICLLGQRYGWIPDEIPQDLIDQEPWLAQYGDRSVTELEILHGVLNDPRMADNALFYFRSPAYIASLPADQRRDFLEEPSAEEIEQYGLREARARAKERSRKLADLKDRIRASGLRVREDYPDPQSLSAMVFQDLLDIIDRLYPEGSQPDLFEREAQAQEFFISAQSRAYVERGKYNTMLDERASNEHPPLVFVGEPGSGKTALLANWAMEYRKAHRQDFLLMHFVEASPMSANWVSMVMRFLHELKTRFRISEAMPNQMGRVGTTFAEWLRRASSASRIVIVIDGLNKLEDLFGWSKLFWLPQEFPAGVRAFLSTTPAPLLEDLDASGCEMRRVEPLDVEERRQIITRYLAQYRKSLSADRINRIARASQSGNPLFLRSLLEELRVYGDHFTIDARIDHYLAARTTVELHERILERYEQDYELERKGLVRDAMSLLWAARRGLSEPELLDLLGSGGEPLPRFQMAQLYFAARHLLMARRGLVTFGYDPLRQAVANRYLSAWQDQREVHLRIADYFSRREPNERRTDELQWQLFKAKEWERLASLLGDLSFLADAMETDDHQVRFYWAEIEANSLHRMTDVYKAMIDDPARYKAGVSSLAKLLLDAGHLEETLAMREHLIELHTRSGNRKSLAAETGNKAAALMQMGELDEAIRLLKEQERLAREEGDRESLAGSLNNQTMVLYRQGRFDEALSLLEEQEQLCRDLDDEERLGMALNNHAAILIGLNEWEGAMQLLEERELICRKFGDKDGLARTLGNMAVVAVEIDDFDRAIALHEEEEQLFRELGDRPGLARSLGNQANLFYRQDDLKKALALRREEVQLFREIGDTYGLVIALSNQALNLIDIDRGREALAAAEEARQLVEAYGLDSLREQAASTLEKAQAKSREASIRESLPVPHRGADPDRAAQLNLEYQQKLARWKSLPWHKRLREKKPEPPRGI
ncbi:MAG: tetratricopeptide repeat protein [Acidobacteriota bacterium]